MEYQKRISIDPGRRSGKPCIRDTRITVYDILRDFPELETDDIRAAVLFAADRERRLTSVEA